MLCSKPLASQTPKPPANAIIRHGFSQTSHRSPHLYITDLPSTICFIKQIFFFPSVSFSTQSLFPSIVVVFNFKSKGECLEDESNKQSLCGSQRWSRGGHERPTGDLQVELCNQISAAKYKEPSQVLVSGKQKPFFFKFCNGFKQSKRAEIEAVRGVFEDGHVLELLGSQLRHMSTEDGDRRPYNKKPLSSAGRTSLSTETRFEDYLATRLFADGTAKGDVRPSWSWGKL